MRGQAISLTPSGGQGPPGKGLRKAGKPSWDAARWQHKVRLHLPSGGQRQNAAPGCAAVMRVRDITPRYAQHSIISHRRNIVRLERAGHDMRS